ncbi:hypothetical protein ACFX2K_036768 [Malus domestica]
MVRRTRELTIKGVNFCELRQNEKKALKANCDAQMSEKVETGRYKSPIGHNKLSAASNTPRERFITAGTEADGRCTLLCAVIFLYDRTQCRRKSIAAD